MKNLLIMFLALVAISCEKPQEYAYYGAKISDDNALNAEEFTSKVENSDSLFVKVEGEILKTCAMKGCWMTMNLAGEEMRVTFKDYGFFVPKTGMEGKSAIIEGYATKVTTDVETLKHFAKDEGKSQEEIDQITAPKEELSFVATGVIIKDVVQEVEVKN